MRTSLEDLFEREFDAMVRLARVMLGPGFDIDDVVMTAFVATATRLESLDSPGAYLRTAVVNGCRRRLRDTQRRKRIWEERLVPTRADLHTPARDEFVGDLLGALSERERTAIVLTYYVDLTTAQAAEVMGCRPGTVKSLVSRGMAKMRRATQ